MSFIICAEWNKYSGSDRIKYMEDVQIPYLIQKGFKKSLGYLYFWLAYECCENSRLEKGIGYFKRVLNTFPKSDGFYAAALSAIQAEQRQLNYKITPYSCRVRGELLEYRGGKLFLEISSGYGQGEAVNSEIFNNSACCDNIIYDEGLKEGESFTAANENMRFIQLKDGEIIKPSEKKSKVVCKSKVVTVKTPGGVYENCTCYIYEGDYYGLKYCETYFCRGVGIVRQIVERGGKREEWQLAKCRINGGDEIVPFAEGNRWEYCLIQSADKKLDAENVFEIIYTENGKAAFSSYCYVNEN